MNCAMGKWEDVIIWLYSRMITSEIYNKYAIVDFEVQNFYFIKKY